MIDSIVEGAVPFKRSRYCSFYFFVILISILPSVIPSSQSICTTRSGLEYSPDDEDDEDDDLVGSTGLLSEMFLAVTFHDLAVPFSSKVFLAIPNPENGSFQ